MDIEETRDFGVVPHDAMTVRLLLLGNNLARVLADSEIFGLEPRFGMVCLPSKHIMTRADSFHSSGNHALLGNDAFLSFEESEHLLLWYTRTKKIPTIS